MRHWIILFALPACSTIPNIRYEGDGGSLDADVDSTVSNDAEMDASKNDSAIADATSMDGGGCPNKVPPGAVVCCGVIPCGGPNCGGDACAECAGKCSIGALCCPNNGGKAQCFLDASSCP